MTTYKWLSHWKTCTSGSVVKSWPMMSKVSGSNPAATKVFFRGLNDVYVCHVTWNTKMTTSDRKKKFSTWNHIENACRKLTESWDGSSLIRSSSRRPWNFPDGQMVPGRYPDAVCYQGSVQQFSTRTLQFWFDTQNEELKGASIVLQKSITVQRLPFFLKTHAWETWNRRKISDHHLVGNFVI